MLDVELEEPTPSAVSFMPSPVKKEDVCFTPSYGSSCPPTSVGRIIPTNPSNKDNKVQLPFLSYTLDLSYRQKSRDSHVSYKETIIAVVQLPFGLILNQH